MFEFSKKLKHRKLNGSDPTTPKKIPKLKIWTPKKIPKLKIWTPKNSKAEDLDSKKFQS